MNKTPKNTLPVWKYFTFYPSVYRFIIPFWGLARNPLLPTHLMLQYVIFQSMLPSLPVYTTTSIIQYRTRKSAFLIYRGIACGAGHFYAINFPKQANLEEGVFVRFKIFSSTISRILCFPPTWEFSHVIPFFLARPLQKRFLEHLFDVWMIDKFSLRARLSFCHYHTMEEVATVLKALQDIVSRHQ